MLVLEESKQSDQGIGKRVSADNKLENQKQISAENNDERHNEAAKTNSNDQVPQTNESVDEKNE